MTGGMSKYAPIVLTTSMAAPYPMPPMKVSLLTSNHGIDLDRRQGCPDPAGEDFRRILVRITTGNRENDDLAVGIGPKILLASGEGKIVDVVHDRIAVVARTRIAFGGVYGWWKVRSEGRRRDYRVFTDRELAWKLLSRW